jgi:two-component system phosphate regulon response regulator PhoB
MRAAAPVSALAGQGLPDESPTTPSLLDLDTDSNPAVSSLGGEPSSGSVPTPPVSSLTRGASTPAASVPRGSSPSFEHWRASDPIAAGPSARVLLVDDDRDIRDVVGAMLDAVGLLVESATSAEEALERVRRSSFDLVVLDWNLPGMTGIELCRLIRRDPALSTLPVLFLTAHASSKDVVEAFASGADDYVVKPFRAPELGARIFGLLRRARMASPGA